MARADYEGRILRSVLLYPEDVLFTVLHGLEPKHFTSQQYRQIFVVIQQLSKDTDNISSDKIVDAISEADLNPQIVLNAWSSYYDADSIREPMKKVRDRAIMQDLSKHYHNWQEDMKKTSTNVQQHIVDVMDKLYRLQATNEDQYTAASAVDRMMKQREQFVGQSLYGVPLGISDKLDFITMGMQPQRLWLVGGYTSVGKSWVAVHIAKAHIKAGVPVLWLSYEMAAEELMWRLAATTIDRPDITLSKLKNQIELSKEQEDTFQAAVKDLRTAPLHIVDNLSNWDESRLAILYHIYAHGVKCVIVDYVQNITLGKASEYEGLNIVIRDLQRIAVSKDVFVAAFSQINRESARNNNERVFGYKGSGNLENAADIAMTLRRLDDENQRLLIVGKNRNGQTGDVSLRVNFDYGLMREDIDGIPKELL